MTDPTWEPGRMVAHYCVQKQLAAGGLGTVYLAEDRKLHRKVALKVLNSATGAPVTEGESLLREARAAAALNHPTIVSIYEVLELNGRLVLVMEWVDGDPLGTRTGEADVDFLRTTASDLASALEAAHQTGIVHGDIKPANVIVGSDRRVRLLDFGIARRIDEAEASGELFSGTIPYMSPELIRGASPSPQSDLWALGVLLYELAAGLRPFTGDYEAAIQYAIMHGQPGPIRSVRPDLPAGIASVIDRLLAKDPGQRFAGAHELLEALRKGDPGADPSPGSTSRLGRIRVLAAAAAGIVLAAAGYFLMARREAPAGRVVAVLPFENLGDSAQDYFALGMTDAVICLLARDTQLSIISRPSVMQYQHQRLGPETIAAQLAADYIITGTIQQQSGSASERLRISAALASSSSGKTLWASVYDRPSSELFALQGQIAADLRTALGLGHDKVGTRLSHTDNLQAYDLYLRGNDYFNRSWSADDILFAIDMYEGAVQADSTYAAAYAMLARAHASMYWEYYDRSEECCDQAKSAAEQALLLDPELADAHLAVGYYYYHCRLDYLRALEACRHALEREPKNADVLNAVAAVERRQGNYPMAAEHFKASLALDPRSYLKAFDLGLTYGLLREFALADRYLDRAIALGPDFSLAHIYKAWLAILRDGDKQAASTILSGAAAGAHLQNSHYYWWLQRIVAADLSTLIRRVPVLEDTAAYYLFKSQMYRLTGDLKSKSACADSARDWLEPRLDRAPNAARYLSYLGLAYANLGDKLQALQYGNRALEMSPASRDAFDALFLAVNMVEILMMVGELDEAVAQIRNMLELPGFVSLPYFRADPLWAPLRAHPEFVRLLEAPA